MLQGLAGFLLFWVVALTAGVALVALATGARFGWLLVAVVPFVLFGFLALRGRRGRSVRGKMPEDRNV